MTDILSRHNFEAIKFSLTNCFKMLRDKISFIRTNLRINDNIWGLRLYDILLWKR